ncbi:hypothetical protein [Undibacterium sp. TS12]|uniref:hypothetical protein n=1 Tax=Undibacterium sp. TS12 TaxID=2908202 RepID=UPI001F4D1604|nr:hypothetical protein [Undibacterium sp. TS12]MCH8622737.1 hypothetical protein [Undibacterium sp. TS12]
MNPYIKPALALLIITGVNSSVHAMTEQDAYRNLMFFQSAKSESEYCENKLHIQAIRQQRNWQTQHAGVLSRSVATLEQHFMQTKGVPRDELPDVIALVWKKLEEMDRHKIAESRNSRSCMKFAESLRFYASQLVH